MKPQSSCMVITPECRQGVKSSNSKTVLTGGQASSAQTKGARQALRGWTLDWRASGPVLTWYCSSEAFTPLDGANKILLLENMLHKNLRSTNFRTHC